VNEVYYWMHDFVHRNYEVITAVEYFLAAIGTIGSSVVALSLASSARRDQEKQRRAKYNHLLSLKGQIVYLDTDMMCSIKCSLKEVEEAWVVVEIFDPTPDLVADTYISIDKLVSIRKFDPSTHS
jgi:hypothetical protein